MALFGYGNPVNTKQVDDIVAKHGVTIEPHITDADFINSSLKLCNSDRKALLSNFPSNCGTLILSNIQGADVDNIILAAFDLTKEGLYSSLMVSTTDGVLCERLVSVFGFERIITDLLNPHSGNYNTFLVKKFHQKE